MDIQYYQHIARKVLDGTASQEEKAELEAFIAAHPHDPALIQALFPVQELEQTPAQALPEGMEERVLSQILRPRQRSGRLRFITRAASVAAAALVLIVAGYLLLQRPGPVMKPVTPAPTEYVTVTTHAGEHKRIFLPDSSEITLNGNTRLRFAQNFEPGSRNVYLEGEAFFDVAPDKRPFVVHAAAISTTVLGTSFNVRSFKGESFSQVAVATGKVKVAVTNATAPAMELTPGELVTYRQQDKGLRKAPLDIAAIGGWKEHTFYYEQTPLRQILADLESAYGLQFNVQDTSLLHCTYTARFQQLPVNTILQTLGKLGQVRFTGETLITVSGKPCQ
ncbi:DUF4974 domain-containing protein [Chitinophaga agrisoli]|uniref:DUF4974 domain-containing protein n=1 Tax=Chitinophaga agrisoli TaxID=2607653 RepID=A0A5B2W254_9BACT|nr:FecR family protein [Chitinophaga agrisoli]KAA2245134.1 DUF4974 domain-containing protein [Chitinophaga agrisoli]